MTPEAWTACDHPAAMVKAVGGKLSGRKLRLIGCHACRLIGPESIPVWVAELLTAAELAADGGLSEDEFGRRWWEVERRYNETTREDLARGELYRPPLGDLETTVVLAALWATHENPGQNLVHAVDWAEQAVRRAAPEGGRKTCVAAFRAAACGVIREVVGPPAHPLVLMPTPMLREYGGPAAAFRARVTGTARGLAEGIARDRAFDRLPILADALEDAGLDDRPLLDHLRHGTGHAPGCWALDLVLGRA